MVRVGALSKLFLMVVVGSLALAQIAPSCGGEEQTIVGWVQRKFPFPAKNAYMIQINNVEYEVPDDFYLEVKVGDLVKYEKGIWTIVKKAGTG